MGSGYFQIHHERLPLRELQVWANVTVVQWPYPCDDLVLSTQAEGSSASVAGGGAAAELITPLLRAALYGATGVGLWWLSKQAEKAEEGNVGMKADATSFDKSITFDDIGGIDESKVRMLDKMCANAGSKVCRCWINFVQFDAVTSSAHMRCLIHATMLKMISCAPKMLCIRTSQSRIRRCAGLHTDTQSMQQGRNKYL